MKAAPLNREDLRRLIPHGGAMCLLDAVIEYGAEEILCETASHRDPANPLRRDGALAAIHLVEYAAQAMAAHGTLQAEGKAQPGMLAAMRDIHLRVAYIHDIPSQLLVRARRRLARKAGSLYEFSVSAGDQVLCEGRVTIALE